MADKRMPPLPSGSVNVSVLHEIEAKGHDLAKAIEKATTRVEPAKAAPAPKAEPTPSPAPTAARKADGSAG